MESILGFDPQKMMEEAKKEQAEARKIQIEILRTLKDIREILNKFSSTIIVNNPPTINTPPIIYPQPSTYPIITS
jgi:hypothetical protein